MAACHRQLYNSSGQVGANTRYDPYGNVLNRSGTASSVYGFTGELTDATGFVDLRARYYDTMQGRFTSQDTWVGDYNVPLTLNQWNYTNGNPINYTDPLGHDVGCAGRNASECYGYNQVRPVLPTPTLPLLPSIIAALTCTPTRTPWPTAINTVSPAYVETRTAAYSADVQVLANGIWNEEAGIYSTTQRKELADTAMRWAG